MSAVRLYGNVRLEAAEQDVVCVLAVVRTARVLRALDVQSWRLTATGLICAAHGQAWACDSHTPFSESREFCNSDMARVPQPSSSLSAWDKQCEAYFQLYWQGHDHGIRRLI